MQFVSYSQLASMMYIPITVSGSGSIYETSCLPLRYLSPIVLQAAMNSYTLFASHQAICPLYCMDNDT